MGLFKPAYFSSDINKRLKALNKLSDEQLIDLFSEELSSYTRNPDQQMQFRKECLSCIKKQENLAALVPELEQLIESPSLIKDKSFNPRELILVIIENLKDETVLTDVFYMLHDIALRMKVLDNINNKDELRDIAGSTFVSEPLRRAALKKIGDKDLILSYIKNRNCTPSFRYSLFDLMPEGSVTLYDAFNDEDELKRIASNWKAEMRRLYEYAFRTINDQKFLSELFCSLIHPEEYEARIIAERLTDPDAVRYAYENGYYKSLLQDKINGYKKDQLPKMSPSELQTVIEKENLDVKAAAIDYIEDQALLEQIAKEKKAYTLTKDMELARVMRAKAILKLKSKVTVSAILEAYNYDDGTDSRQPIKNALLKRIDELDVRQ